MTEIPVAAQSEAPDRGFWAVEPRQEADGTPDIYFKLIKSGCPADMLDFKGGIERALSIVLSIYARSDHPAKRDECVAKLLKLAQLGLVGPSQATQEANAALSVFKQDIVNRESGRIKNDYMLKLGKAALFAAAAFFVVYIIVDNLIFVPIKHVYEYRNILLVFAGCMAGSWASFASRKVVLSFEDLAALEEDKLEPPLRLAFSGILTAILCLVFITGFANVVIGGFRASSLLTSGSVAALIGALAGLAEKALPAAMMQRATTLISGAHRET